MIVKDFSSAKVSDYLDTGNHKKALIVFHHGLGDVMMFYPAFMELQRLYPNVDIHLNVRLGQEELFNSSPADESLYDIVFVLTFPCCEWTHPQYTKTEFCCLLELGIKPPRTELSINSKGLGPFVGTHFFSTCLPEQLGCTEAVAHKIHNSILDAGFIPIDTHLKHATHNPGNNNFSWQGCRISDAKASMANLLGVIARCRGFAGVASGNLQAALALLPAERILFLKRGISVKTLTRKDVLEQDIFRYDQGITDEWLSRVSES